MLRARYLRILWFFGGVLLQVIWWDIFLPRIGLRGYSRRSRPKRQQQIAVRFRTLAIQMGGVMIKVGQFLSARLDVLPRQITDELAGLQDEVQPETFEDIRAVIESEFHQRLEEKFTYFDPKPLASASIGQVHFAHLPVTNRATDPIVVVKVQRPNIEAIVRTDLSALQVVGRWLNLYRPIRRRVNVETLLAEFSRSLFEEIDYLNEGKNAETFAHNFADRPEFCVPAVYWSHTTRRVLTLENIQAIKITDYASIDAAGLDRKNISARLFQSYLQQIFEDRFFHADPHPGNLFVLPGKLPENPARWRLVFVDFGMTGTITPELLKSLRELFIAVGTQNSARVIHAYQMMGILLPGADLELLERAGTRVFDQFWGKSTTEMLRMGPDEARQIITEFSQLIYELPFQVPENLILLARSLSILSGICTGLDPEFNIWTSVAPFAEDLVAAEAGSSLEILFKELTRSISALFSLPERINLLVSRMEQGRFEVRTPGLNQQFARLERSQRRLTFAILFAALLFGSFQLLPNLPIIGYIMLSAAALLLLGAIY